MAVVIYSSGRSGTNMVLEMLRASTELKATEPEEDKLFFQRTGVYPDNYLTKCDTTYCRSFLYFAHVLKQNPNQKVVWTIRDPRDWCMSKIRRGFERESDDATFEGCIADMYHMFDQYKRAWKHFPKQIATVKMEDVLLRTKSVAIYLCDWLGIEYNTEMPYFYRRMRNEGKKRRYDKIDTSQIGLWKNWGKVYDNYLLSLPFDMRVLFYYLRPLTSYFGYEEGGCDTLLPADTDSSDLITLNTLRTRTLIAKY